VELLLSELNEVLRRRLFFDGLQFKMIHSVGYTKMIQWDISLGDLILVAQL
jgi:hypothetical protein